MRAALLVFSQRGFEAARLDEVARKAGVAKGTLYLYYPNKQAMFEALIRSAAEPILADISNIAQQMPQSTDELLAKVFSLFQREILATDRKLIFRLIIAEGPRFPSLARFYHREVITRVMASLQSIASKLDGDGRLASTDLRRYPQLIAAPLVLSLVWDSLFAKIDPLDVDGMLAAHANLMTTARRRRRS